MSKLYWILVDRAKMLTFFSKDVLVRAPPFWIAQIFPPYLGGPHPKKQVVWSTNTETEASGEQWHWMRQCTSVYCLTQWQWFEFFQRALSSLNPFATHVLNYQIQSNPVIHPVIPPTPPISRKKCLYHSAVYKCTEIRSDIPPRYPPPLRHRLVHFYNKAL